MSRIGIAGKLGHYFMESKLTPIIIVFAIALGVFAVYNTPREEEPQIIVPMMDIFVPFPGATPKDVETKVTSPLERKLWEIPGVEYIYSTSMTDMSMITVRFYVGEDPERSLVKLYNKLMYNMDMMPPGASMPLVKYRSIDNVPILALTLWSSRLDEYELRRVAAEARTDIKKIDKTSIIDIIGGQTRQINVRLDPSQLRAYHISPLQIAGMLQKANAQMTSGQFQQENKEIVVETGEFLTNRQDVENLVVGVANGQPVYLKNVAQVTDGPGEPDSYVFLGTGPQYKEKGIRKLNPKEYEYPAVTLSIAKRKGADAYQVSQAVLAKVNDLKGNVIPDSVEVTVTRNYGDTANEKANELISHLMGAIISVIIVVALSMGLRAAFIIFVSVPMTFALTLLVYYLQGYTLNRVTLFALIFVTGIVIDDSIIIAENMYRHFSMKVLPKLEAAITAVNEVGNPTILATLTVIASVLPMAFVSGLMGPYMRPMPVGASIAMIFSLFVAMTATPWLSIRILKYGEKEKPFVLQESLTYKVYARLIKPMLDRPWARWGFLAGVVVLLGISVSFFFFKFVTVKMLPFDNKSEFQVIIDTPEGTTLEQTTRVAKEIANYVRTVSEVTDYEVYAGVAAPYNFNGLVRHYFMRRGPNVADIQVNLVHKDQRTEQSHDIAKRVRPEIDRIASKYGARVKVVEIPPGPPVLSTLVTEVYGPNQKSRLAVAKDILHVYDTTPGVVDVDWMEEANQTKYRFVVDKEKAMLNGINTSAVAQTLHLALSGMNAGLIHMPRENEPVTVNIRLAQDERSRLEDLKEITMTSPQGKQISLAELVRVEKTTIPKSIYHKNLKPVVYVVGDVAGVEESPVYAIMNMADKIDKIRTPQGYHIEQWYTRQPWNENKAEIKWDGEWHITYEVFRDLGIAFAAVLVLMYVLLLGWFKKFKVPLIQMTAIPLTLIGIIPAHMLFGSFFTATSMIGMIALAGIMVRNSVLLIDFIDIRLADGLSLKEAIIESGAVRFRPIALTAGTMIVGAFFILLDPIFRGLAISLLAGGIASTLLTLLVVPVIYYIFFRKKYEEQN